MALVQHASNSTTGGSTIAGTFASGTTAGNSIIVCVTGGNAGTAVTISGIALGGSSDTFTSVVNASQGTGGGISEIAIDNGCTGGHTVVTVTFNAALSSGGATIDIFEWHGILVPSPTDKTSNATGTASPASSGTTATLTKTNEIAFGLAGGVGQSSQATLTGPGGGWTNETQLNSGAGFTSQMAGFQQLSATTGLAYAPTFSTGSNFFWESMIATFKPAVPGTGKMLMAWPA